ncbi:hypothetical protein CsSME_00042552 [Camellia sinensis var. sinensis]
MSNKVTKCIIAYPSEGRLEPVQAYFKKNKRGLGAEKVKKKPQHLENSEHPVSDRKPDKEYDEIK